MADEEITSGRALISKLQEEQHAAKLQKEAHGRWIDPEFEKAFNKYADMRDEIIADFRATHFPAEDNLTAMKAARLPRTMDDYLMLHERLRAQLEPITRQMADLKSKYWMPIYMVDLSCGSKNEPR